MVVEISHCCVLPKGLGTPSWGEGLPEIIRMYGKCRGCVGAYRAVGGSAHGTAAAFGGVYGNNAAMGF